MSQHITVIEYSPLWKNKYKEESLLIRNILADNCIAIYHIGSTSVEGLAAKPIIDIMAVVRSLEIVDTVAEKFSDIGYEYLGEFGIEGRRYLRKGGDERTHQIPIYLSNPQEPLIFQGFTPVFHSNLICLPLFLPLRAETRATFYSPPTTLSSSLAEVRFASLVE